MKKLLLGFMAAALAVTSVVCFTACANEEKPTEAYGYVSLKINPEVDYVVDENGIVVSYFCLNEDAEVLLADVDLTGKTIEEATQIVLDLAIAAGYLDADTEGDEIEVGAIDKDGKNDTKTYEKIAKNLNEYFANNGIFGKVSQATLDLYLQQASELGRSVGHIKLLMLACERSGKSLDEIKDLPMNEIMKIIHNKNGEKIKGKKQQKERQNQRKEAKESKCNGNADKVREHKNNFEKNKEKIKAQIEAWQEKDEG